MDGKIERKSWHPGFVGAMEIDFISDRDKLTFEREHNLSKEPLSIDLLIIKKENDAVIQNQIGRMFRRYNIIEYKSPDDGLTIDDYCKTAAYAYLYKSQGRSVDALPLAELTITMLRDAMPVKFFKTIRSMGGTIFEKYPGIYYIDGVVSIPTQFVLTRALDPDQHTSLRLLTKNLTEKDARLFISLASGFTEQGDRHNVNALLQVSVSANMEVFESIKRRDSTMYEALKELMKDEIMEERRNAIGDERTRVAKEMLENNCSLALIENISKLPEATILALAKSMGITIA